MSKGPQKPRLKAKTRQLKLVRPKKPRLKAKTRQLKLVRPKKPQPKRKTEQLKLAGLPVRVSAGAAVTAGVGHLRAGWQEQRGDILRQARDVVSLCQELHSIFARLKGATGKPGDNLAPYQAGGVALFEDNLQAGVANIRVAEEQLQSDSPLTKVIRVAGSRLKALALGLGTLVTKEAGALLEGIAIYYGEHRAH